MSANNFKIIVALKSAKELKQGQVKCTISIKDKLKYTVLPQAEGQFFDINDLPLSQPIVVSFDAETTNQRLGEVQIFIPDTIYEKKELELADTFTLEYEDKNGSQQFKGRYYIIILNKGQTRVEQAASGMEELKEMAHQQMEEYHQARVQESPTKQFLKSTQERTQERTKEKQAQKLLSETKYDPKSPYSLGLKRSSMQQSQKQLKKSSNKKSQKQLSKYNSQKQLQKSSNLESTVQMSTPSNIQDSQVRQESGKKEESSPARQESPRKVETPRRDSARREESPYSKYRGKKEESRKYSKEAEYWKGVALQLESGSEISKDRERVHEAVAEQLRDSEQKRAELQQLVKENVRKDVEAREELEKRIDDLLAENAKLHKRIKALTQQNVDAEKNADAKALELKKKEKEVQEQQRRLKNMEEVKRICAVQQAKLEEQQQKIKTMQAGFDDKLKELANSMAKVEQQVTQLLAERKDMDLRLADKDKAIEQKNVLIKNLEHQLARTRNEVELKSSWELTAATLKKQNNDQNLQLIEQKAVIDSLQQLIAQLRKDLEGVQLEKKNLKQDHLDKQAILKQSIKGLEIKLTDSERNSKKLEHDIVQLKQEIGQLTIRSKLYDDLSKSQQVLRKNYEQVVQDNQRLSDTVGQLSESLQTTNNQILELRSEVLSARNQVENQEHYSNNLKKLILEMKERGVVYVPNRDDGIDTRLADIINSRDDADVLTQLFNRESSGVYQFGTKKIYIKQEHDKILIRQGGGYMSVEEFLSLYSQREMDAISRQDPLADLAKKKAVTRKSGSMKPVSKGNA